MCGIAGIYNVDGRQVEQEALQKMTDILRHRGPEGEGHWISEKANLGFGHRRLAIIDTSPNARQPMFYGNRFVITFNGEIYNYIELKEELQAKGYQFNTRSDTEVLLAMYQEFGEDCLSKLDGMFAFAVYDIKENFLFCARDRFGEKPFFYYWQEAKKFVFASEIKAISESGIPKSHNERMIFRYLAYNLVENPHDHKETFFENIYRLEPGQFLTINGKGEFNLKRYWNLTISDNNASLTLDQAAGRFHELFYKSVTRRLRADVPVGTSLSGGIDSSAVVMAISKINGSTDHIQNTFSARFHDPDMDEGRFIGLMTKAVNVNSHETWVSEVDFINDFEKMIWFQEEPVGGASAMAQWQVMKLAAENGVTVLLDGQGADEILGGYLHYFNPLLSELFWSDRKSYRQESSAIMSRHPLVPVKGALSETKVRFAKIIRFVGDLRRQYLYPPYLNDLSHDFGSAYKTLPPPFKMFRSLNDALYYSTMVYGLGKLLRLADRNSMAFSREIRLPFLSHQLIEFAFTLPSSFKIHDGWTKLVLRKAFEKELPKEIVWRVDKQGYQPPQAQWMQHPHLRMKIEDSIAGLISRGIIKNPDPSKEWSYLMLNSFLNIH